MTIDDAIKQFPRRTINAHKGDLGHLLVIAGSIGYTGAPYLTSQAAVLSGCGLVTLALGKSIYPILATKLTEVMVRPFIETKDASLSLMAEKDLISFSERCNVLAVGPGISRNRETQQLARNLVAGISKPIVLDADGIGAFEGHLEAIKSAGSKLVLTPHVGELSRLINRDTGEIEQNRKDVALAFANEYNTVLVLKGHNTIVARAGGDVYINQTGNPGMASGGTGDVLTGMIASFIAQGAEPFAASVIGVYLHGIAGDIAVKAKGVLSLLASDLLQALPEALKTLA